MQESSEGTPVASVSLIFVHNHRFEANLPRFDAIYGERFRHIQHLVPFYRGAAKNVISVYDSSHRFENFFAQGREHFVRAGCTHYVFCADDMILNPRLNENNLCAELGLDKNSGFTKFFISLTEAPFSWPHATPALSTVAGSNGANWKAELPDEPTALARLKAHGIMPGSVSLRRLDHRTRPGQALQLLNYVKRQIGNGARSWKEIAHLPYPLLSGYADFLIVPADAIEDFCHYCGIFAAAGLFVEVGAPTALALSCRRVVQEKDVKWKGVEYWKKDIDTFCKSHDYSLKNLFERFPPDRLYVHPIKLSKWK